MKKERKKESMEFRDYNQKKKKENGVFILEEGRENKWITMKMRRIKGGDLKSCMTLRMNRRKEKRCCRGLELKEKTGNSLRGEEKEKEKLR